ncbi:uncharacterized protein Fot_33533 [Forsythia ovata]|uniref:ELM2 domain-containing protein n=2 Tax=Forsythia ovata TaxID=205694 RepID=A0ABD1TAY4_9LAMI
MSPSRSNNKSRRKSTYKRNSASQKRNRQSSKAKKQATKENFNSNNDGRQKREEHGLDENKEKLVCRRKYSYQVPRVVSTHPFNGDFGWQWTTWMGRKQGGEGKKNGKAPLCKDKDIDVVQINSIFGRYSEPEMLVRLKGLALDPCKQEFSRNKIQSLWNQILRLRKVMVLSDSEIPWRKRKLQEFVKDELRTTPGCVVPNQIGVKLSRGQLSHASSVSCVLNSVHSTETFDERIHKSRSSSSSMTFEDILHEEQPSVELSFLDDVIDWNPPNKDVPPVVDSDESVNVSDTLNPENLTPNEAMSRDLNVAIHVSDSPTLDRPDRRQLQPPCQSIRFLSFICDHLQRKVVPVGPRFQADVPEWNGLVEKSVLIGEFKKDFQNSRWLGNQVWPIEVGIVKPRGKMIGKGRPDSCCCVTPGSVNCIRRHILEGRLLLQCDLGPAFFGWKFDEMGEQVSKSWTLKEQQTFESLVKMKPLSNGKNFLKQASNCFPTKSRKNIISYYFNVVILQHLSMQTRSPLKQVDSDDDEVEDFNYMSLQKSCQGKNAIISNCKDVKTKYLRMAS